MADLKTQENDADVDAFLNAVEHNQRREDGVALKEMMERITGWQAKMWGASIVGFGAYEYDNISGKGGRWMVTGFSPRKANLVLYIMNGFDRYDDLLAKLGKHKKGKSCLYVNKLADVDMETLETMVSLSVTRMREMYNC